MMDGPFIILEVSVQFVTSVLFFDSSDATFYGV